MTERDHKISVGMYIACLKPLVERYAKALKASQSRDTFTREGVEYDNGLSLKARQALSALALIEGCIEDVVTLANADGVKSWELLEANADTHELWVIGTRKEANGTTS